MDFEQDNAAEWDVSPSTPLHRKDSMMQGRSTIIASGNNQLETESDQLQVKASVLDQAGATSCVGPARKLLTKPGTKERKWPKVRPQNDWTGKEHEKTLKEERKRFAELSRMQINDDTYGNKGLFLLHGHQIEPRIIMSLLQDLRATLKCQVQLDQDDWIIEVLSDDFNLVQKALRSIRAKVTSLSANDNGRLIIVDRPGDDVNILETTVCMKDASSQEAAPKAAGLNVSPKPKERPEMVPCIFRAKPSSNMSIDENTRLRRNSIALRLFIDKALGRLLYRHGFVQMRVNFGALIFHRYQWPLEKKQQASEMFIESLRNPRTELSLYKLTPENRLYEKIGNATDFLSPWSSKIDHISQTTPFYVGRFVWFRQKENRPPWIFEATTEPIEAEAGKIPSVTSRAWLQPSYPGSCREMEVFITQLNGGISCAIEITSEPHTGEKIVYPRKKLTAQDVRIIPTEDFVAAASKGLLVYDPRPSGCHLYVQRTVWRFRLSLDQRYLLELIRYDRYNVAKDCPICREPIETRWDAVVYNEDWDSIFAGNKVPDPEAGAGWIPSTSSFFPDPEYGQESGDGIEKFFLWIRDFLDCLNKENRAWTS